MEKIYLRAFCINMLMNKKELVSNFVHVLDQRNYTHQLAEEFIERDLIKMFEATNLFQLLTFWQILLLLVTAILSGENLILGYNFL